MPDTGRLEVPMVPVRRPETITNSNDRNKDNSDAEIAMTMFPPETMKPEMKPMTIPAIRTILADEPPEAEDFALSVSLMEDTIVGISLTAPIKPPESIMPAPDA